jgi:putative ABC transport system permease protein
VRELATIKVLGFYDKEVSDYICRENTAAALLGMAVGLVGGIFLEEFVVGTAEVDVVMFIHEIPFSAYLYAAALTILFILLVNRIVHHGLKKINMVESLKSVE